MSRYIYFSTRRASVPALKEEMARRYPSLHFSYSSGGFLTYKLPEDQSFDSMRFDKLVFARTAALSCGRLASPTPELFWQTIRPVLQSRSRGEGGERFFLHIWEPEYQSELEPSPSKKGRELFSILSQAVPEDLSPFLASKEDALPGALCIDLVLPSDGVWWLGTHRAELLHQRYPGGIFPLFPALDAVSRAWLKFEEGLWWSEFPIGIGARCADIGAAPGGGSQALLSRGAQVLGVDPAAMAPELLSHPNFTHLRGRISQLRRNAFQKVRWIIADMNVAPNYTLEAIGELALRPEMSVRGLLFTLKFFDLDMARGIPEYIQTVKSWGFNRVKVRQLTFNHQEVMVAAIKKPFVKNLHGNPRQNSLGGRRSSKTRRAD